MEAGLHTTGRPYCFVGSPELLDPFAQAETRRMVALLVDGLRYGAKTAE